MKKSIILILISVNCLSSCGEKDNMTEKIVGTWLIISEKRSSDSWTQSDENGITTDWQILNPFGSPLKLTSIKINDDQTFFWNVENIVDWEHYLTIWNNLPKSRWNSYSLNEEENLITLNSQFEYVGIIEVVTTEFHLSIVHDDLLTLKNEGVELKLSRIYPQ